MKELKGLTGVIEKRAAALAEKFSGEQAGGETISAVQEIIRQRSSRIWAALGGRPD